MSVELAPHYQHFWNIMRVLTSFAIVLEFLIGFRNSSGLQCIKNAIFEMRSLLHAYPHYWKNKFFSRVLGTFSIVLEFLTIFRNSSGKLQKIWLLKISTIFFKILFLRVPRVLFRVLDFSQIVLQISLNTFYFKIKIQKTMVL